MSRPAMVFVHGWAQSSQTWHAQLAQFGLSGKVRAVNLPGHGGAAERPADEWEDALLAELPEQPAILVGWSLGGMLAMDIAAKHPERLAGLVLVATTPSFRRRHGWDAGCSDELFAQFCESLDADAPRLMERFFALMLLGDDLDRRQFREVAHRAVDRQHPATAEGLRDGLQLLDEMDLRGELSEIDLPTLLLHGSADAVVPVEAGQFLAARMPHAQLRLMSAGHAPHLTRPMEFNALVEEWCRNHISTQAG